MAPQPHHFLALSLAPLNVRWRTDGAWEHVATTEPAALFMPAGIAAACGNNSQLDALHLRFSPARLRSLLPEFGDHIDRLPPGNLGGDWVKALASTMRAAHEENGADETLLSDSLLLGVGTVLLHARSLVLRVATRRGLSPWQLQRIQTRLAEDLDRDVGLDELAGLVGLTPTYLCTAFRDATGLPPHQWQKRRRVERAKELLRANGATIADVARSVGYSNASHFATVFRAVTGLTPSAWRREHFR